MNLPLASEFVPAYNEEEGYKLAELHTMHVTGAIHACHCAVGLAWIILVVHLHIEGSTLTLSVLFHVPL